MKYLDERRQASMSPLLVPCVLCIQRTVRPVRAAWGMPWNCSMFLYALTAHRMLDFWWSCVILATNWYQNHLHWVCTFVLYHVDAHASWSHTCRQINKSHRCFENINGIRNDIRKADQMPRLHGTRTRLCSLCSHRMKYIYSYLTESHSISKLWSMTCLWKGFSTENVMRFIKLWTVSMIRKIILERKYRPLLFLIQNPWVSIFCPLFGILILEKTKFWKRDLFPSSG
jgi:hypothetical protein